MTSPATRVLDLGGTGIASVGGQVVSYRGSVRTSGPRPGALLFTGDVVAVTEEPSASERRTLHRVGAYRLVPISGAQHQPPRTAPIDLSGHAGTLPPQLAGAVQLAWGAAVEGPAPGVLLDGVGDIVAILEPDQVMTSPGLATGRLRPQRAVAQPDHDEQAERRRPSLRTMIVTAYVVLPGLVAWLIVPEVRLLGFIGFLGGQFWLLVGVSLAIGAGQSAPPAVGPAKSTAHRVLRTVLLATAGAAFAAFGLACMNSSVHISEHSGEVTSMREESGDDSTTRFLTIDGVEWQSTWWARRGLHVGDTVRCDSSAGGPLFGPELVRCRKQ